MNSPYTVTQAHPLIIERNDDAPDGAEGCLMHFDTDGAAGATAVFTEGANLTDTVPAASPAEWHTLCFTVDEGRTLWLAAISRNGSMQEPARVVEDGDQVAMARHLWNSAGVVERVMVTDGTLMPPATEDGAADDSHPEGAEQ